jgi:hypothetical protein
MDAAQQKQSTISALCGVLWRSVALLPVSMLLNLSCALLLGGAQCRGT